jgi:hypothetical protein
MGKITVEKFDCSMFEFFGRFTGWCAREEDEYVVELFNVGCVDSNGGRVSLTISKM